MHIKIKILTALILTLFCTIGHSYDFKLTEKLGRDWTNEFVTFPLNSKQLRKTQKRAVLIGPDGKSVPWQLLSDDDDNPRIGFQVDLGKNSTKSWKLSSQSDQKAKSSNLKIENTDDIIRISNGLTGISIAKHQKNDNGPISGIKLNSGKWVGQSSVITETPVTSWKTEITESGPVMAEITSTIAFGDRGIWETRYRLYNNEPVVLVDELFLVDAQIKHDLNLSKNFDPTELFYRYGKNMPDGKVGKNSTWSIKPGRVFEMEPWLIWWLEDRRGSTFSLYNKKGKDLLTIAAREAGAWVDPGIPLIKRTPPLIHVSKSKSGVITSFPLAFGERKWMIGAFGRDESLSVLNDSNSTYMSPLPYRYLVKYGHFPLDLIKDYKLSWPGTENYPRLLVTETDINNFKAKTTDQKRYKRSVKSLTRGKKQLKDSSLNKAIPAFLATGDSALGKQLTDYVLNRLQYSIDYLIDQNGFPFGAAPHHQLFISNSISAADIIMDSEFLDPESREQIQAKVAFLAYTTSRPEYWSPERDYEANPNMTTTVYSFRTRLAAFISDHPQATNWIEDGMQDLRTKLDEWSDDNGGWLEAPHYAIVAYDDMLSMLLIAYNAGINDWLYTEPKVKKIIQWIAKISTPPDSRIGGYRHHPAIGNTYLNEPTGEFGLLAYLFQDKDPEFSAQMQWQFNQSNRYKSAGIGGAFPAFSGYRKILTDPTLPEKVPNYKSELFTETGLVLRDTYPSDRETYLHMIQGENHDHYDFDSGSILIYGKGRIISDEFGYYGRSPQKDHSMLDFRSGGNGIMKVREHVLGPRFDYAKGIKGPWSRQIIMVKGKTPEEPAYFVINDTMDTEQKASWRLWLTAQEVNIENNPVHVVGKEDVDTDIYILTPDKPALSVEEKSRKSSSGMKENWRWGPMTTTQLGLTLSDPNFSGMKVVIYPRLKNKKTPTFKSLADGKGVKITHESGTDYVFLSKQPFKYKDDKVQFNGTAGMAQFRNGKVVTGTDKNGSIKTNP